MRRIVTLLAAALALGAGTALAAEPESFIGHANGVGLELTIQGSGLTVGYSDATVETGVAEDATAACDDGAVACAVAAGELALGETAKAWWPGNAEPQNATAFALPADFNPLLTGRIGEAVADANDAPAARGVGGAAEFTVTATQTIIDNLPPELRDGLEQLTTTLEEEAGNSGDPTGLLGRAAGTLNQVRENASSAPILQVFAGSSESRSLVEGDVVTATSRASGAVVVVAPFPGSTEVDPQGVAIVTVGRASATATTDQFTADAEFTPAIASLAVLDPASGEYDEVSIQGDTGCALEGTPLQICVTAGAGEETVEGASAAARADAVRIEAFPDTLAVSLRLASAEASVGAAPAAPAPIEDAGDPVSLPRTGGGVALPALLALAAAGTLLFRRRA